MTPRHFIDLDRFEPSDLHRLMERAHSMKARFGQDRAAIAHLARGKVLTMLFAKPSTRTRVSFDVAMRQLGGGTIVLNSGEMQLGRGETIADTARVLSRYVDVIMLRTTKHAELLELAEHAGVPVINGLTNYSHPCQVFADVMTFEEQSSARSTGGWSRGSAMQTTMSRRPGFRRRRCSALRCRSRARENTAPPLNWSKRQRPAAGGSSHSVRTRTKRDRGRRLRGDGCVGVDGP